MLKLQSYWLDRAATWLKLSAIILLGATSFTAMAAPVNDNFVNALSIAGLKGATNGSNVGATMESGEPVDAGVGGGKTIWYLWTATANGTMLFNTEGSDFDTALAVYTGTSVNSLTLVAQNDDVAFPGDLTSSVTFPVVSGTTYYIQVDGNEGDSGDVNLNWTSTGAYSMGSFTFASGGQVATLGANKYPLYIVGDQDSTFHKGPTAPWMTDLSLRARVIRTNGNAGKVGVAYTITNTFYTNFLQTNIFGTNLFFTNANSSYSNILSTNYVSFNQYQNFVNGGFTYCPVQSNAYIFNITNKTGFASQSSTTQLGTALPTIVCGNSTNTGIITNTDGSFTFVTTNIFCTNVLVITNGPTAIFNRNYSTAGGTLSLIDFQSAIDITYTNGAGPLNSDPNCIQNAVLVINLISNIFDPLESSNLAPATIATGKAYVEILNSQGTYYTPCTNLPVTGGFARSIFATGENVSSAPEVNNNPFQRTARVYALRGGTDASQSLTLNVMADEIPTVPNSGRINQYNTFSLQPGSDYATPPSPTPLSKYSNHFTLVTTTVSWGPYDFDPKAIDVTINYDSNVQFNEDILLELYNPSGGASAPQTNITQLATATLTILFNDQPAGAVDRGHNPDNSQYTDPPYNSFPGAGGSNNTVYAAIVQSNNQTLFSGDFRAYDTVPRNRIARMNADGSLDTTFMASPNSGANDTINCMALQPDGKVIIGGVFTSFNGTNRFHIARLNSDGSLDSVFNTGVGVNGSISAMQLQPDGKVIIAGNFTSVNSTNCNFVARLNTNGSLDSSFAVGIGPSGEVKALALQADGSILVGGLFTSIDNYSFSYIARLATNGALDTNFNPGFGADQPVYALAEQTDGKVMVGGAFQTINLTSRSYIARLNGDGSLDSTFNPGTGPDGVVYSLAIQPDGNILVGGLFSSINGTRRVSFARLLISGAVDTSFLDTGYNQFAGFINNYNNPAVQQHDSVFTIALQQDGNVIVGGRFDQAGGGSKRDSILPRENITRLIGNSTPGPGNIGLLYTNYTADKSGGQFYVSMSRDNGALGQASVTLQPNPLHTGTGNAIPNQDYQQAVLNPTWGQTWSAATWAYSDDFTGPNYTPMDVLGRNYTPGLGGAYISISNNVNTTGNLGLDLQLTQPAGNLALGGEPIALGVALGNSSSPLTIVDDDVAPGTLVFSQPVYYVNENGTNAVITVIRTNGASGTVTVQYSTIPGTALPGATNDYLAVSNSLTFFSGDTVKTFTVPIVNNFIVRPDRVLTNILFNATGGATIGTQSNAALVIINDNFLPGMLSFTMPSFTAQQLDGSAIISVNRTGGSQGTESISFSTSDGSGSNNVDYLATNGVLTWNNADTSNKTFTVKLLNSGLVNSNATINLSLYNPVVNGTVNSNALGLYTNAILTISNNNHFGSPTLSASNYYVNESAGVAVITVNRLGGTAQTITVDYYTSDGTAQSGSAPNDYTSVGGTLTFTNGQFSQSFTVPIIDNTTQTNNGAYFTVNLVNPEPAGVTLGAISSAPVYIIADQVQDQPPGSSDTTFNPAAGFNANIYSLLLQPNGSMITGGDFTQANGIARNRIARLDANGLLDVKFSSGTAGANGSVRALGLQTDGQILVGGLFTTMNGVNANYIARLNYDGSLDSSFNTGGGADNPVYAVAETFAGGIMTNSSRKILVGGSFASVNGVPYRSIAQLNEDGSVDTTFVASGANGTIYAIAIYPTNDVNVGKILIAGDFTSVNGTNVNHVARLNADGSLDTSFNSIAVGSGPNDSVRALAIQIDGKVVIGGLFTSVSGNAVGYIARLDAAGQADPTFTAGLGANNAVIALAVQQDLKIVVGGSFTQASGVTRNRLTRLNADGTVDAGINFGLGANDFVDAIAVQQNNQIVFAGGFTQYDGAAKQHIDRIFGGTETGSGKVQFTSGNYQVNEGTTNIVIGIERTGGTGYSGPGGYTGPIDVVFSTSDGTAMAGIDYIGVTNTVVFQVGETFQTVVIPILTDPINLGELTVNLSLTQPTDGNTADYAQLGDQSAAVLNIVGANSTVSFSAANYSVNKSIGSGAAVITVTRNYSSVGTASIDYSTTTTGTATPGLDFTPVSGTLQFADGQATNAFLVPIINNGLAEGNLTVGLALNNPTNTALDTSLPSMATLTILDNSQSPGNIAFASASYAVPQTGTNILISVIRTNGSVGAVSVNYATTSGTATAGTDYIPASGQLAFIDGQTSNSFLVTVLNNTNLTADATVNLLLSQPTGGASLTVPSNAVLTIQNQNYDIGFAQTGYFVDEQNGTVTVGVNRTGSTNGTLKVNFATTNGSAMAGVNYTATSGTLTFQPGQSFESFTVPILYDPLITGDLIFFINLTTTNGSPVKLVTPTAIVTVLDDDTGFAFASATNSIVKGNTNAVISVSRVGKSSGAVAVSYSTTGGTAAANVEYLPVNGILNFAAGQTSNSFLVPILNDDTVDGTQTVNLALSSPTAGAQLLVPSNSVLTIIDNESGISFSSASYSVNENGGLATITVNRTGVTTTTVSVNYATANGTALANSQYTPASGTLTFTNGQTSATFNVLITDNNVTGGSETVLLQLSGPSANGTLVNPSAATLTINNNDGSLIQAAGSAVIAPTNGVIYANSNATVLFSLLNAGGSTATNVTATLLATNGITPTGTTNQNYGNLIVNGPSVFRQFTFNTAGTNGSTINAVLQLHYGTNTSYVSFTYALGSSTNYYTNNSVITINDYAPASPFPSSINVSQPGSISKVTATVSNLGHSYISDVVILLVGPAGQKELLMDQNGGPHVITNVTLTFDSSAVSGLTTNAPTTGTYRPATQTSQNFPASSNNVSAPAGPYVNSLTNFNGSNPNGAWQLYVQDIKQYDSGAINGGWGLTITTLNVVASNVDLVLGLAGSPNPVIASNVVTYTIGVTNAGPSTATDVIVSNVLPAGVINVGAATTQGSCVITNGVVICSLGTLVTNATASVTITVTSTNTAGGTLTNTAIASCDQVEDNAINNSATVITTVNTASADLAIGASVTPQPDLVGNNVTYNVAVTNLGPATSTGIYVTNMLPAGATLISTSAPGTVTNAGGLLTFSLPDLSAGSVSTFSFVVKPAGAGTNLSAFGVFASVFDPLKGNNSAAVRTVVQYLPLSIASSGSGLTFRWPLSGSNYVLQYTTSLPTTNWITLTNMPTTSGGTNTINLSAPGGTRFYRLISQ